MREAELLIALAHDGGIQMNLTDKVCTVETKYPGFTQTPEGFWVPKYPKV